MSRFSQVRSSLVQSDQVWSSQVQARASQLYLRSPGSVSWHSTCAHPVSAKSMIWLWPSVCTRICADLDAVHRSPYWLLCSQNFLQIMVGTMCTLLIFACLPVMSISVPLADLTESPTTNKERQALETLHCQYCGVIGKLMWDRSTCHPHMITCSPARPSLSPTLSFMALYLRSPSYSAKLMILAIAIGMHAHLCRPRYRTPLSMFGQNYTPSINDYMPSMPSSNVFLNADST